MAYAPIGDYGLIGNMHTAALLGRHGSIDWLCLPHFDSPSVFGAILDDQKGGRFQISARNLTGAAKQFYWPDSNILVTRFFTDGGIGELIDFMPVPVTDGQRPVPQLVRMCGVVTGEVEFDMLCEPAFDYARAKHQTHLADGGAFFKSPGLELALASTKNLEAAGPGVRARFRIRVGDSAVFALHLLDRGKRDIPRPDPARAAELFRSTLDYWRRWLARSTYRGRWREQVHRSVLALKLLTFEPTGAIVAAPTCSLPAPIGGERNWDYRYTWIRDAAFTLYGLMRVGFTEEAVAFMDWLAERCHELEPGGALQPLYGIDGRHKIDEEVLDHLEGYRGSRPVRIGNAAYRQLQIDVAGELMDSVYLHNKYAEPVSYDLWTQLTRILTWVCDNWEKQDTGLWEVRGPEQHFVYSKLMCWVALDRGLRLAEKRSFPADVPRWRSTRDNIYRQIMDKGWDSRRKVFVQRYGSDALDAANLMMPLVFFVSPHDPRMLSTLDAVMRDPAEGGLLSDHRLHRYLVSETDDGLEGEEDGFNICTFWLIEALTRAGRHSPRHLEKARLLFERMLASTNHLGLLAEQTGRNDEALGNFPQAFTHLSLISAAFNLDRALSSK